MNVTKPNKELDLEDFKILIVEDYSFVSTILSLTLKEMGIGSVLTVENGCDAQTKVQAFNQFENHKNIDLIILDWLMPIMGGKAFLKWLRSSNNENIRFLPVIICSGYTSDELVKESRDLGANEVIVKPVSAAGIAHRIQYIINNPRPFVKSKSFFGPDRRRQKKPYDGGDQRKLKPQNIKNNHEQKQ